MTDLPLLRITVVSIKTRSEQEENLGKRFFGAWGFTGLGKAEPYSTHQWFHTYRVYGKKWCKKEARMPRSKRDVKYSAALFYFEKYFLVRDCLGEKSFGELLRKIVSSLSLDCLSKGKCCHGKMASVLALNVQLKAKECASKPSKGPQWKGDTFISPEIYRAHIPSSPHTTWGHSTSLFFKFTVFIWYLCCMRANSRHSSSGVWVSPKQGNSSSPRNTHLPSAFPSPHSVALVGSV